MEGHCSNLLIFVDTNNSARENRKPKGENNGLPVKEVLISLNMLISHDANSCDMSHAEKLVSVFISCISTCLSMLHLRISHKKA